MVFCDYVLGEFVFGVDAKDTSGVTVATVPCGLVLSYEHEMRKQAMRLVKQCSTLKSALSKVVEDGDAQREVFLNTSFQTG